MKKLVFLLGSLVLVGATASAKEVIVAPVEVTEEVVTPVVAVRSGENNTSKLRVTSVNTGIWSENKNGRANGSLGENSLRLYTNFAYGDNWTGEVAMRRYFLSNDKSYGIGAPKHLFIKEYVRGRVGIMRNNIFDNYGLGVAYEFEGNTDKYEADFTFAPASWLDGYFIYQYVARQNGSDSHYMEFQPKLSYKDWGVSYYFEGEFNNENDGQYMINQVRLFTPTFKYAGFGIGAEYRGTISHEAKNYPNSFNNWGINYKTKDPFGVNRVYAVLSYDLSEATTLWTNIGYEFGKWEDTAVKKTGNLYQTIVEAGVQYKF